ncbi:MAG: short-chain dehydrogenase [Francisellaceae bacterium]|nr:short-chain dehydrogenase [Francisellaceae bacterium]
MLNTFDQNFRYNPSADLLKDRVILVTGASRGIGRAIALGFASYGATVVLLGRTLKALETLYDEIIHLNYPKPAIYPLNLLQATPEDFINLKNNIDNQLGSIQGLVLNAGILGQLTPIEHYPIEHWYKLFQVNLHSNFLLTQAFLPLLKQQKDSAILFNAAYPHSQSPKAYWGAYHVTKAACFSLMEVLAAELEINTSIRVNSIEPPAVNTYLRQNAYPGQDNSILQNPKDLLPYYLYLMGEDSKMHRGKHFSIIKTP